MPRHSHDALRNCRKPFHGGGRDHKIDARGRVISGRVDHDRIQQASACGSIGEEIRRWYSLPGDADYERIDVEAAIHRAGHFILTPTRVRFRNRARSIELERPERPLSLNRRSVSPLWRQQIDVIRRNAPSDWEWICDEIRRVVADHRDPSPGQIHEVDLLRTSGALGLLGVMLGPYLVRGYDCASRFRFLGYPDYACPVEIKKQSRNFRYQISRYCPLPRAVVLCVEHNLTNPPLDIDVIELSYFTEAFGSARGGEA